MNMKPQKPLPKAQTQIQVDLKDAETIKCEDCGNSVFIPAFFIKRLSPIVSPTGQEALIPIQVYSCGNCGKVPDKFKQDGED
jgi:DNA-directed RNA polymerase subunit RPC12/RpoP|tara:strand:+ start:5259 stop:5504 length:246 start_codon:yes stop_codon:yes gene_type:complete